jgi:para-nitrobenzyl esterase
VGGAPTWQYQFEQSLPGLEAQGAQHSFELPYVFGSLPAPGKVLGGPYTAADKALSDRIIDFWTNFARTGAPGNGSEWPRFTLADRAYLRLSTSAKPGADVSRDVRRAQCALFERSLIR